MELKLPKLNLKKNWKIYAIVAGVILVSILLIFSKQIFLGIIGVIAGTAGLTTQATTEKHDEKLSELKKQYLKQEQDYKKLRERRKELMMSEPKEISNVDDACDTIDSHLSNR